MEKTWSSLLETSILKLEYGFTKSILTVNNKLKNNKFLSVSFFSVTSKTEKTGNNKYEMSTVINTLRKINRRRTAASICMAMVVVVGFCTSEDVWDAEP